MQWVVRDYEIAATNVEQLAPHTEFTISLIIAFIESYVEMINIYILKVLCIRFYITACVLISRGHDPSPINWICSI